MVGIAGPASAYGLLSMESHQVTAVEANDILLEIITDHNAMPDKVRCVNFRTLNRPHFIHFHQVRHLAVLSALHTSATTELVSGYRDPKLTTCKKELKKLL